jgi:hypothetical protein
LGWVIETDQYIVVSENSVLKALHKCPTVLVTELFLDRGQPGQVAVVHGIIDVAFYLVRKRLVGMDDYIRYTSPLQFPEEQIDELCGAGALGHVGHVKRQ